MATPLQPRRVDVVALLAERRLGTVHVEVLTFCGLALLLAGYDAQVLLAALPTIARSLDLPAAEFQMPYAWGAAGAVLGAIAGGFGDEIGRRRAIIWSLMAFGVTSLLTMLATEPVTFSLLLFCTGLGFGVLLPNALALSMELMPRRNRPGLVGLAWVGFPVGMAIAQPVSDWLLLRWTWPSVFFAGGLLPFVLGLAVYGVLPDSPPLLLGYGDRGIAGIRATLVRISRRYDYPTNTQFVGALPEETGFRVKLLFRGERARLTPLLWVLFFAVTLGALLLMAGASAIANRYSPDNAPTVVASLQGAGILGTIVLAFMGDRFSPFLLLAGTLLLGAMAVAVFALLGGSGLAVPAALLAMLLVGGGANALCVFAAAVYATPLRATGIGWALAAGRAGQFAMPFVVAAMQARHVSLGLFLGVTAVLVAVAAAVAFVLSRRV